MRCIKQLLIGCITMVMLGCAATRPPTVYTGLPEELPVHASSSYETYLKCLGTLLVAKVVPDIDVLIVRFADITGPPNSCERFLSFGGSFMARTAMARRATRVSVSTPTAYDAERTTLLVKGGFTELDRVPMSYAWGMALRLYGVDLTFD